MAFEQRAGLAHHRRLGTHVLPALRIWSHTVPTVRIQILTEAALIVHKVQHLLLPLCERHTKALRLEPGNGQLPERENAEKWPEICFSP